LVPAAGRRFADLITSGGSRRRGGATGPGWQDNTLIWIKETWPASP
jgi:hypothetical protein